MHRRLLPILLLCSSLLVGTTDTDNEPQYKGCSSNANYTRGSAFQANLDALLSSLPATAAASSGFAKNATGSGAAPEQAYGLAQCRADVNASDCRACLDGLVRDIYDRCELRHSNTSSFGNVATSVVFSASNLQNTTEPEQFTSQLGSLMSSLRTTEVRGWLDDGDTLGEHLRHGAVHAGRHRRRLQPLPRRRRQLHPDVLRLEAETSSTSF
jgi:hypothetical protein